ncbi:MAG TPA: hypothetical protein DCM05_17290 [Elusimicrobia bacterium]|nr:hypothetical protein [Elusimicrobiota bacterium]
MPAALLLALLVLPAGGYDLGGPCGADASKAPSLAEISAAEEDADWSRALSLQKAHLRALCSSESRWSKLADLLLKAGRKADALEALEEMDRRGFEVKASEFAAYPALRKFLGSEAFQGSAAGRSVEAKRRASHARKRGFRERLKKLPASSLPPPEHVSTGACPFECCAYREWTALADTELFERPGGGALSVKAAAGTKVAALTGEVRVKPIPLGVAADRPPFAKGDLFFLLDPLGEGFYHYWKDGLVAEVLVEPDDHCLNPGPACWAEFVYPGSALRRSAWWVQLRLPDGTLGWTDRPEDFDGKDACD